MWIGTWPVSDYTLCVSMRVMNSIPLFRDTLQNSRIHLSSLYILTDKRTAICCHTIVYMLFFSCCFFPLPRRFIYRSPLYTHKLIACFMQLIWFQVIIFRDKTCIQFWSLNTKPLLIYIRALVRVVCVSFVPPDDDGKKCFKSKEQKGTSLINRTKTKWFCQFYRLTLPLSLKFSTCTDFVEN